MYVFVLFMHAFFGLTLNAGLTDFKRKKHTQHFYLIGLVKPDHVPAAAARGVAVEDEQVQARQLQGFRQLTAEEPPKHTAGKGGRG